MQQPRMKEHDVPRVARELSHGNRHTVDGRSLIGHPIYQDVFGGRSRTKFRMTPGEPSTTSVAPPPL